MADLSCKTIESLEKNKFDENTNGDICVRTCTEITGGSVATTPDGISGPFKITTTTVTNSAIAIPLTPLTDRKSISIINLSATDTIFIGSSNLVTANRVAGTTAGWELAADETINFDFKDTIIIYGITESGKSALIKILEVA